MLTGAAEFRPGKALLKWNPNTQGRFNDDRAVSSISGGLWRSVLFRESAPDLLPAVTKDTGADDPFFLSGFCPARRL